MTGNAMPTCPTAAACQGCYCVSGLYVCRCPVRSLPEDMINLSSLQTLKLQHCAQLEELSSFKLLRRLTWLDLRGCVLPLSVRTCATMICVCQPDSRRHPYRPATVCT